MNIGREKRARVDQSDQLPVCRQTGSTGAIESPGITSALPVIHPKIGLQFELYEFF
jgi:hypothetical protein